MSDFGNKMNKPIKSHRDLIVWQKAMDLTVLIYEITKKFPSDEKFGLISQIRRCSSSIAANIAEGQGRRSSKEFQHFLTNARGSLLELDTHLELSFRVEYINKEQHQKLRTKTDEVGRILNGLLNAIKKI